MAETTPTALTSHRRKEKTLYAKQMKNYTKISLLSWPSDYLMEMFRHILKGDSFQFNAKNSLNINAAKKENGSCICNYLMSASRQSL